MVNLSENFGLREVLFIPFAIAEALVVWWYLDRRFPRLYDIRTHISVYLFSCLANMLLSMLFYNYYVVTTLVLLCFAPLFLLYKSNTFLQRLSYAGVLMAFCLLTDQLTCSVLSLITDYSVTELIQSWVFLDIRRLINLVIIAVFVILASRKKREHPAIPQHYFVLLLAGVYFCVGISSFFYAEKLNHTASLYQIFSMLMSLILASGIFLSFRKFSIYFENQRIVSIVESHLAQDEERFRNLEAHNAEIRALRHDIMNILISVRSLARFGETAEIVRYINHLIKDSALDASQSPTGLSGLDAILSEKIKIARDHGIEIDVDSQISAALKINTIHLSIITGNALDNAIEACMRLPKDSKRYISVAFRGSSTELNIKIENPSPPVHIVNGELPLTSKSDKLMHGFGLIAAKRLVNLYGGTLRCRFVDGKFIFQALMMNTAAGGQEEESEHVDKTNNSSK